MEDGYRGDENFGALLNINVFEEFNHYVPDNANVDLQQPCQVVQYPN